MSAKWRGEGGQHQGSRPYQEDSWTLRTLADGALLPVLGATAADPEFDAWRWAPLSELPALAVPFKRPIYEILARSFAPFAAR